MKLGIMQPYFFPYIGYWQLMANVDTFVILDDVNFIKRGWINRNNILLNGKAHLFTIPLEGASQNKLIMETKMNFPKAQRDKWLKTIQMAYGKAPYFSEVFPLLQDIMDNDALYITDMIEYSFRRVLDYLNIEKKIIRSSEIEKDSSLKASARILAICEAQEANCYINPIGGQGLYHEDDFADRNITLRFIKTRPINYQQFGTDFVSNLSFIDVLMFNSPVKIMNLLKEYDLVRGEL